MKKIEKDRNKERKSKRGKEREGEQDEKNARTSQGEREQRELQFHRIPEDEGAAVLEAFHGKPNIRGMLRRCRPEFPT